MKSTVRRSVLERYNASTPAVQGINQMKGSAFVVSVTNREMGGLMQDAR